MTGPAGAALAAELCDAVDARAVVQTGVARALVDLDVAKLSREARSTLALEAVDHVLTSLRALAALVVQFALVDVVLAVGAVEAEHAGAAVARALVRARGVVAARARAAVVDHVLAARAEEARRTLANVCVVVVAACGVVHAWVGGALVDVDLAQRSRPARLAETLLLEQAVDADAVDAGVLGAEVVLDVTAFAGESRGTVALEVVDQVLAGRVECAGLLGTVI